MSRSLAAFALVASLSAVASADRLPTKYVLQTPTGLEPTTVSSNVIFLDRCTAGCPITYAGNDDSRTDKSSIGGGNLSAFSCGDAAWTSVVSCVKDVFRNYNVVITTTDPGSADHLEIKIAGTYSQLGIQPAGGIAPFKCQAYQTNALVFDFANVWQGNVEDICSTAAQEIAHTWSLDHSTDKTDPMTYYPYTSCSQPPCRRYYDNVNQQCGSDCVQGQSPFGQTCTGSSGNPCTCQ